ncbi:hypothetical protein QU39_00255, partial [Staphylococcus aureus]
MLVEEVAGQGDAVAHGLHPRGMAGARRLAQEGGERQQPIAIGLAGGSADGAPAPRRDVDERIVRPGRRAG